MIIQSGSRELHWECFIQLCKMGRDQSFELVYSLLILRFQTASARVPAENGYFG